MRCHLFHFHNMEHEAVSQRPSLLVIHTKQEFMYDDHVQTYPECEGIIKSWQGKAAMHV